MWGRHTEFDRDSLEELSDIMYLTADCFPMSWWVILILKTGL